MTDDLLLLGGGQAPAVKARRGIPRIVGRGFVDDDGAFNPLYTTLFPAAWAARNDVPRLRTEFGAIRDAGCYHGYRSGTGFAGDSWADRMADPRDVAAVAAMADLGYEFGLRACHCLFMDGAASPGMETQEARRSVVRAFGAMLHGREHKFMALEIVNERDNGNKLSIDDTRELAALLSTFTRLPIILSRCAFDGSYSAMYRASVARCATGHWERDNSADGGYWEHLSKPSEWPDGYGDGSATACVTGEPKGTDSSGGSERNVLRLTMAYAIGQTQGIGGYCFHTGPGIRMGGAWDANRYVDGRKIAAHLSECPEWAPVSAGYKALQAFLPPDLATWDRWRGHWTDSPLDFIPYRNNGDNGPFDDGTFFKWYVSARGNQVYATGLRITRDFKVRHRTHPCRFDVYDPLAGKIVLTSSAVAAGEWITVPLTMADAGTNPDGYGLILKATLL